MYSLLGQVFFKDPKYFLIGKGLRLLLKDNFWKKGTIRTYRYKN